MSDREELRHRLRNEPIPDGALLLRGGPDTAALIRTHARRTQRLFFLDGEPLWGISVFAALDSAVPASLEGLLSGRLATYPLVHRLATAALLRDGFTLVPTFRRPHFTVRLASDGLDEADRLLRLFGPAELNPYNRKARRAEPEANS